MTKVVNVTDTIEVSTEAPLVVNLSSDRTVVRTKPELGLTQVSLSDSYQVVPYAKRITTDYTLPESVTQGLFVDIADLREDIVAEAGTREIAILEATTYAKDYADSIESQVYNTINAAYIGSVTGNAYALKDELVNLTLSYNNGTGLTTGTIQEIFDRTIAVENNQLTYNSDLQGVLDNYSGLLTRTESIEVSIDGAGGLKARLDDVEGVAAGQFKVWYGAPEPVLIGMIKFTDPYTGDLRTAEGAVQATDVQWQYVGGNLGEGGWVQTDASAQIAIDNFSQELAAGALAELQAQIDGEIASWFYAGAPGPTVEPELTWINGDTANGNNNFKLRHIGDMYYDDDSGVAYRYTYTEPNVNGTWTVITDNMIVSALAQAQTAQAAADRKILTFSQDYKDVTDNELPTPIADGVGDLWVVTDAFIQYTGHTKKFANEATMGTSGMTDPTILYYAVAEGTWWEYNAGFTKVAIANLSPAIRRWSDVGTWEWLTTTDANVSHGWAAGASKIVTGPNGEITGWSFADGSNIESTFAINASNFYIANGVTQIPVFTVNTTDQKAYFNADVEFQGLGINGASTGISGDKITTGSIDANLVNVTNLNASNIKAGVIYNTGGNAGNYTMKIDLDNGEIHIL